MPRRAFTLLELLVVISIIGLLSGVAAVLMNASRPQSRDAKRMADMQKISQAIDMFAQTNVSLPQSSGWCTYISNPTSGWGAAFQADLSPAYLGKIPLDPQKSGQVGDYFYYNFDDKMKYAICAILEKPTGKSYNFSGCAGGTVYNYCVAPNGT